MWHLAKLESLKLEIVLDSTILFDNIGGSDTLKCVTKRYVYKRYITRRIVTKRYVIERNSVTKRYVVQKGTRYKMVQLQNGTCNKTVNCWKTVRCRTEHYHNGTKPQSVNGMAGSYVTPNLTLNMVSNNQQTRPIPKRKTKSEVYLLKALLNKPFFVFLLSVASC